MSRICTDCGREILPEDVAYGPAHYPRHADCNRKRLVAEAAREADFRERVSFADQPAADEKPLKERELRG